MQVHGRFSVMHFHDFNMCFAWICFAENVLIEVNIFVIMVVTMLQYCLVA